MVNSLMKNYQIFLAIDFHSLQNDKKFTLLTILDFQTHFFSLATGLTSLVKAFNQIFLQFQWIKGNRPSLILVPALKLRFVCGTESSWELFLETTKIYKYTLFFSTSTDLIFLHQGLNLSFSACEWIVTLKL